MVWGHRKGCSDMSANSPLNAKQASGILTRPAVLLSSPKYRVIHVACGHNFTIAVLHNGQVLSWGSNSYGALGHGNTKDYPAPKVIETLKDEIIVSADAGHSHAGFITLQGKLYMCGKGKEGALGLGNKKLKDETSPQLVTFPEDEHVVQLSCSKGEHHEHTLALTNSGRVYAWGDGYKGKVGTVLY